MEELEIAKRRAMHLLAARDYGKNELYKKLLNNYSEKTAAAVTPAQTVRLIFVFRDKNAAGF